jgi:hypothetical protein
VTHSINYLASAVCLVPESWELCSWEPGIFVWEHGMCCLQPGNVCEPLPRVCTSCVYRIFLPLPGFQLPVNYVGRGSWSSSIIKKEGPPSSTSGWRPPIVARALSFNNALLPEPLPICTATYPLKVDHVSTLPFGWRT